MVVRLFEKVMFSSVTLFLVAVSAAIPLCARTPALRVNSAQEPDVSFILTRLPDNPKLYSLVISGPDERVISGTFSVERLQILRAVMIEAEKFAMTGEGVGAKEPITTRFLDKQEPAFVCDVQKTGGESAFFLTLETEAGRNTLNAGLLIRSTRREQGMFFDLLSRLEEILPKPPAQKPK